MRISQNSYNCRGVTNRKVFIDCVSSFFMKYKDYSFIPKSEEDVKQQAENFGPALIGRGYSQKMLIGIKEVLRNAFEHGNQRDLSKKIILYSKIDECSAKFIIGDQGEVRDSLFEYLGEFNGKDFSQIRSFYEFLQKTQPRTNGGAGIKLIYYLTSKGIFDEVRYSKGEKKNLLVCLQKKNETI